MKKILSLIVLLMISLNAFAGIQLSSNFTVNTALPIDDRMEFATEADRNALPALRRWEGMIAYVKETETHYALIGGLTDDFWAEIGGGKGGIAEFTPFTEYKEKDVIFNGNNRIYFANQDFTSASIFNPNNWTELSPVTQFKGAGSFEDYAAGSKVLVPNKQITRSGTDTIRIETGNNNVLMNPSAEYNIEGWLNDGDASSLVTSAAYATDGDKSYMFNPGAGARKARQNFGVPSGLTGLLAEASVDVYASGPMQVCAITSEETVCKDYTPSMGRSRIVISFKPSFISNRIEISRVGTLATDFEYFDNVYVGIPKDPAFAVIPFKNTTKLESCGLTTADFQGFGTVTNIDMNCAQDGEFLVVAGRFQSGTPSGAEGAVKLKFKGRYLVSSSEILTANSMYGNWVRGTSGSLYGSILAKRNQDHFTFGSQDGSNSGVVNLTGTNVVGGAAGNQVSINARIPIAEWSDHTNAAIVACKEGPLKCANVYSARISSTGVISGENIPGWLTSCTNALTPVCTFASGIFTVAPNCWSSTEGAFVGRTTSTLTTVLGYYLGSGGTETAGDRKYFCQKTGSDYNEAYDRIVIQKDDADIRSTEWLTGGFDYIDNKPIYRRCHRVASDVTADNATIATWDTNLQPINAVNVVTDSNMWNILSASSGTNIHNSIFYDKVTGRVRSHIVGGAHIKTGTTFCMNYTKP